MLEMRIAEGDHQFVAESTHMKAPNRSELPPRARLQRPEPPRQENLG
jgi:hypothetical protein